MLLRHDVRTFWDDLNLAARLLRKDSAFTLAATLTLALGIGANATILSLGEATLLRPLPVPDGDRIVHVYQRRPNTEDVFPLSYADYLDYRAEARSFDALAAHYPTSPMHVVVGGEPQSINGSVVTATYFDLLKLQPALGRWFVAEEDRVRDRDAVAVISHGFWRLRFNGTAGVIGQTIRINDHPFSIVGVAPEGFAGVHNGGLATDVWIPTAMFRVGYRFCDGFDRSCTIVDMLGTLKAGVSIAAAQEELDVIARRLALAYPDTNTDLGVTIVAARGRGYGSFSDRIERRQLQIFLFAVGLVFLIGCANVAGLLLARAIRRRKEVAVRLALGATRSRLIRQLLTESVLLAALGGVAGLMLAFWGKDLVSGLNPTDYAGRPRDLQVEISGAVIVLTTGLTLVASVVFGLVPALQASKPDVIPALKEGAASGEAGRARLRHALIIGQIALAVTLVIGASLLVRSLRNAFAGPGFDPRSLVTLRLRPGLVNYPAAKALEFQRQVIARLAALPGVVSASPADGPAASPLMTGGEQSVVARGENGERDRDLSARQTRVGSGYFATLGVPLVEGREFDDRDHATAPRVAVINDVLARQLAPAGSAVGRTLLLGGQPAHAIVGVVKDAQYYATGQAPAAVVYRSYWQPQNNGGFNRDSRTLVRVRGDAHAMMTAIRREVAAVDPAVPISEDYPLSDRLSFEFQPLRAARTMLVSFGALAVFLSAVGLYGVLAFTVSQRTREIGIRVALGAESRDVTGLVLRDAIRIAVSGAALGVGVAWLSARFVASLLYGIDAHDVPTFLAAPAALVLVALAASYFPARRAARVSPLVALRHQ